MSDERDRLITKIICKDGHPNEQLALAQEYSSAHPEDAEFKFFVGETLCVTVYDPKDEKPPLEVLEEAADCFESLTGNVKYGATALKYLEAIHYFLAMKFGAIKEKVKHYNKFGKLGHESESLLSLCEMYINKEKWEEAEKCAAKASEAGVPKETIRKVHLYLAENHPDLKARAKHYSALGDPNSLLSVSLQCAEQNIWQYAEDFANKSITAGLSTEATKRIRSYLAEKMPALEAKIRNYAALTNDPFALLAISLLHSEQNKWGDADSYADKSIQAGLPEDLSRQVHFYFAANLSAIDGRVKRYQQLTDGNNALMRLSFESAQEGKWDEAITYLEACVNIKADNENLKIARVMKVAQELIDINILSDDVKYIETIHKMINRYSLPEKYQPLLSQLPKKADAYRLFAGIAGSRGYPKMQALTLEAALNLAASETTPDKETEVKALKENLTSFYRKAARDSKDNGEKDTHYQNLLRHLPEDLEANLSLARIKSRGGESATAAEYYSKVLKSQPEHLEARVMIARNYFSKQQWKESYEHYREILSLAQAERVDWETKYRETKQLSPEEKISLNAEDIATFTPPMKWWYQSTGDAAAFLFVCYQLRNEDSHQKRAEKHLQNAMMKAPYSYFNPALTHLRHFLGSMWVAARKKVNLTSPKARIKHFGYDPLTIPTDKLDGEVLKLALGELEKLVGGTEK